MIVKRTKHCLVGGSVFCVAVKGLTILYPLNVLGILVIQKKTDRKRWSNAHKRITRERMYPIMSVINQLTGIDPSVPDALFRRLLYEEELGYLREGNTIMGFEVDLIKSEDLKGYALIAIQKHTILAFRSDLNEPDRLILFPSMDKLDDSSFGLQSLTVQRKTFVDDTFEGVVEKDGLLQKVAADLIPPYKAVEVDDEMAHSMRASIKEASFVKPSHTESNNASKPINVSSKTDVVGRYKDFPSDMVSDQPDTHSSLTDYSDAFEDAPIEHPDMFDDAPIDPPDDVYDADIEPFDHAPIEQFDSDTAFDESNNQESEHHTIEDTYDARAKLLDEQSFTQLHEVSDYVTVHLNISKDIASTVLNAALNATPNREQQINVAVQLFIKAFNNRQL